MLFHMSLIFEVSLVSARSVRSLEELENAPGRELPEIESHG